MVALSVLNRKVVEEHNLRNLANVYLRLMYMCSMYVYMYVYMHGFIIQLRFSMELRTYLTYTDANTNLRRDIAL